MGSSLAALLLVFALLGALLYFARRAARMGPAGLVVQVVDAVNLGGGRAVAVVRSGQRFFLLGTTAQAISLIAELEAGDLAGSTQTPGARGARARPPVMPALVHSALLKHPLFKDLRGAR